MKRSHVKYSLRDALIIVFFWLLVAAMVYMVYLKIKILQH